MTGEPVAVTGATGRLGGRVARRLADRGVPQRLVVRDASRAPSLPAAGVAVGEYADGAAMRRALDGVRVALLVSGSESPDRVDHHRAFVDAAADAGVEHLVYVSFFGADPEATFTLARDHWATEQHARSRELACTFLRDNLYGDFVPLLGGREGVIRGPAADGRAGFVALDDIAEAAAAVLLDPAAHAGHTYDLTGPEALTLDEAARIASEALGRPIRYERETVEEAHRSRQHHGAPDWQVEAWVSTYTAIANGELDGVTTAVPDLTGHPATPLADVLRPRRRGGA